MQRELARPAALGRGHDVATEDPGIRSSPKPWIGPCTATPARADAVAVEHGRADATHTVVALLEVHGVAPVAGGLQVG